MALHQGPLARRFRVADLVLHTTVGPVSPRLQQAGVEQAVALFDAQSASARLARKRQTTEQWLAQVAPDIPPGDGRQVTPGPIEGPQLVAERDPVVEPQPVVALAETPVPTQKGQQHG
jgi:putative membrane protein